MRSFLIVTILFALSPSVHGAAADEGLLTTEPGVDAAVRRAAAYGARSIVPCQSHRELKRCGGALAGMDSPLGRSGTTSLPNLQIRLHFRTSLLLFVPEALAPRYMY